MTRLRARLEAIGVVGFDAIVNGLLAASLVVLVPLVAFLFLFLFFIPGWLFHFFVDDQR